MTRETTKIDLPPPGRLRSSRARVPMWVWISVVTLSIACGAAGGIYLGSAARAKRAEAGAARDVRRHQDITRLVAEARLAVADGQWIEARTLFEQVRELDSENADALASLPLIDRRLAEARGKLAVQTNPSGSAVELPGFGHQTSPAVFNDLPFGRHTLTISKEGFETVSRPVEIMTEEPVTLPIIELAASVGRLEVVSEPRGADFALLRDAEKQDPILIAAGKTPAEINDLASGEYEVRLSAKGWPEHREKVTVQTNRSTSVSAVFAKGALNITSDPPGAEVWIRSGAEESRLGGVTPLSLATLPVGQHSLELRHADWTPIRRTVEVTEGSTQDLTFSWDRSLVRFESDPPGATVLKDGQTFGPKDAVTPFQAELPKGQYQFEASLPGFGKNSQTVMVEAESGSLEVRFPFEYGKVRLESDPPGATVVSEGKNLGRTPLFLEAVPPGNRSYDLSLANHRSTTVWGKVEPGSSLEFSTSLKYDAAPSTSRNFKNGSLQEMVWIGELNGWVAAHETTQAQYESLAGKNPSYFKSPQNPVDTVTWYEATTWCEALTVQERSLGNLPEGYRYRLPTDKEWSVYVGGQKLDGAISSLFERQKSTAPVGSLAPNEFGLYDVRGNVWEWVSDWYSQAIATQLQKEGAAATPEWIGTDRKVLRGGAWSGSSQFDLSAANRSAARPAAEDRYDVGFRVVLMKE